MNIRQKTIRVIAETLNYNEEKILDSHNIIDDLGADSIDQVEVVMGLEEEFDINISDEDAEKIQTVSDAVNAMEKLLK